MGQLLVRNLSDDTIAGLKRPAADHGRSVEAEPRAILDQTVAASAAGEAEAAWIARLEAVGWRPGLDSARLTRSSAAGAPPVRRR